MVACTDAPRANAVEGVAVGDAANHLIGSTPIRPIAGCRRVVARRLRYAGGSPASGQRRRPKPPRGRRDALLATARDAEPRSSAGPCCARDAIDGQHALADDVIKPDVNLRAVRQPQLYTDAVRCQRQRTEARHVSARGPLRSPRRSGPRPAVVRTLR